MKAKEEKGKTSGTIKINPEILKKARVLCAINDINIKAHVEKALEKGNKELEKKNQNEQ